MMTVGLVNAEGSKQKGLAAGLWCGAAGGLAHVVADRGWIQRRMQKLLADLDLADPVQEPAEGKTLLFDLVEP